MLLKLHFPKLPLSDYIEFFTFYEGYNPGHSVERLLPEGVVEIILDLTTSTNYVFDNETLKPKQSYRRAWISGMRSKYISIGVGKNRSSMFVIRFRPGKAYPFLQIPLSEMDNLVVDSDDVMNGEFTEFRDKLIETHSPEAKFALAEHFILAQMRNHLDINPAVSFIVKTLSANPCSSSIAEIVQSSGYSHKHLLSLFGKHVGLSPKEFLRVKKFQQTIRCIEESTYVDWVRLAHDCGYYDQAHFINDFKQFSGFSPLQYMEVKSEFVNYIPIG